MARLELDGVRKSFGAATVIHDVDLEIPKGEFCVFVGPSGCGKSTLLRLIAGLEDITAGELRFDGEVVNRRTPSERGIAMVFQSYALYPHMTVRENMAFGLKLARRDRAEAERKVMEAARMLQLEELLERLPKQLSGGQRQRVAIGRAIVRDPRVFLFDEPLSNLDAALRVQTRIEIAALHQRMAETTMIYVTHDQVEAMTLADRIVVLRDGRVEQVGTPMELYRRPANRFVAQFIGSPSMNVLPAEVRGAEVRPFGGAPVALEAARGAGEGLAFGVRPEDLSLAGEGEAALFEGPVTLVERLGEVQLIYLDLAGEAAPGTPAAAPLVAKLPGDPAVARGAHVRLAARPEALHLFDGAGRALT